MRTKCKNLSSDIRNSMFKATVRGHEHRIHASFCIWWHLFLPSQLHIVALHMDWFSMEFVKILGMRTSQIWTNRCQVVWPGVHDTGMHWTTQNTIFELNTRVSYCFSVDIIIHAATLVPVLYCFHFDWFKFAAANHFDFNEPKKKKHFRSSYCFANGIVNCVFLLVLCIEWNFNMIKCCRCCWLSFNFFRLEITLRELIELSACFAHLTCNILKKKPLSLVYSKKTLDITHILKIVRIFLYLFSNHLKQLWQVWSIFFHAEDVAFGSFDIETPSIFINHRLHWHIECNLIMTFLQGSFKNQAIFIIRYFNRQTIQPTSQPASQSSSPLAWNKAHFVL